MRIDDMYPSTFDAAPMMGAQDDEVLAQLENAAVRVRDNWTVEGYVTHEGAGCAIGNLLIAAGVTHEAFESMFLSRDVEFRGRQRDLLAERGLEYRAQANGRVQAMIETLIRGATIEAIRLLNESAVRLYPQETKGWEQGLWNGPLEHLNQELDARQTCTCPRLDGSMVAGKDEYGYNRWTDVHRPGCPCDAHAAVMACYEDAINRRKGLVPA